MSRRVSILSHSVQRTKCGPSSTEEVLNFAAQTQTSHHQDRHTRLISIGALRPLFSFFFLFSGLKEHYKDKDGLKHLQLTFNKTN